jgi:anti-sigma B factor antagonist
MPNAQVLADSVTGSTDALPPAFVCSRTEDGLDAAWVRVAGELDLATVPQLERSLQEPQLQARLVVLDLRKLAFMDSAGVHAIVNASIRARHVGGRLVLLRGPANVDRVFRLAGSSDDLEIREDPAELPVRALLQVAEGELAS